MIELVISGGQTGGDQAGWRAAKKAGIPTGGWCPKGFRTENEKGDGSKFHPEFKKLYGAQEADSGDYPARTKLNVRDSDITIYFRRNSKDSAGYICTWKAALGIFRPFWDVNGNAFNTPEKLYNKFRLFDQRYKVVNIAGTRESSDPGVGKWTEEFLDEFFQLLKGE